ncbi:trypsin-like peptidase domain-containing protein [Candidatus Uhrbacteria bacterium]|nr:trypsin-like peptidase domain-containing protein [Candidatus Uhrbacteria bacterium]
MTEKNNLLVSVAASAVTAILVSTGVFFALTWFAPQFQDVFPAGLFVKKQAPQPVSAQPRSFVASDSDEAVSVVKRSQAAVVAVAVLAPVQKQARNSIQYDPFSGLFSPMPEQQPVRGSATGTVQIAGGSGFFVTADGLIATNKHVVQNSQVAEDKLEFKVRTFSGKTYPAKVVAVDPVLDLAFLKVEGSDFPYLSVGDSDGLQPGQSVIAIGNALDQFNNTVTRGVISGLNRRIVAGNGAGTEVIDEAIQTDAAINPGNSGGPLLDLGGKVVGINTAVSDRGQSLGFAIPASAVKRDLDSIQKFGHIVRPYMGVRYVMVTPEYVKNNQLKVDYGALVVRGNQKSELAVSPGSPADKAGIKENDIILEIDGVKVEDGHSLSSLIGRHVVGDEIKLKISHAGEEKEVTLKLEELKTE